MSAETKEKNHEEEVREQLSASGVYLKEKIPTAPVNPFINHTLKLTPYETFKLIIGSFTIAPIRFVLILLLMLLGWAIVKIALFGLSSEDIATKPLSRWRKNVLLIVRGLARVILFVWGFYWIPVKGKRASFKQAPILVSNHISMFDGIFFFFYEMPRFISRKENLDIPIIGSILQAMQSISVDRQAANSKKQAVQNIIDHANHDPSEGWPRLLIFPEGTCNNQKGLISFKAGAFIPGKSVQAVAIKYPYINFDCCWLNGVNLGHLFWRSLCQFENYMEVHYLPPHKPTKHEIENPLLFANNIRASIAKVLNIPVTEHSFEDIRFAIKAMKLHMRPEAFADIDLFSIKKQTQMTEEQLEKLLQKFSKIDKNKNGELTIQQFCKALNMPETRATRRLFYLMDTSESGTISWKEYVSGIIFLSKELNKKEKLEFAFKLFDQNEDGKITEGELYSMMRSVFPGIKRSDVAGIFRNGDKNNDGVIDYEDFVQFFQENPEYLQLLEYHQQGDTEEEEGSTSLQSKKDQ
ncbi:Lysophosphatidylcholine acyltransferase 2 [Balamuthia mandrillaris]